MQTQSAQTAAAGLSPAGSAGDRRVSCAAFSDVPAFLADIVQGVAQQRFNPVYLEFLSQISLARLLLGAVLRGLVRGPRLTHAGWYLLCVRESGTTLGCALVHSGTDERGPVIDLGLVAVRPWARHRGVGSLLVRHVLHRAEGLARVRCTCTVHATEMVALVQKLGFRRTQVGRSLTGGMRRPDEFTYQRPTMVVRPPEASSAASQRRR